ncbi:glycosyltransferase [Candidatus Woesebacteria bacterium]|nr:glycosyltransferase [Candidatus Woesebacteria bacterium]
MIKNSVILIPNISHQAQVCDYLEQTANILAKNNSNRVFILYHTQSLSIKEIFIKFATQQKLTFSKKIDNICYLYPIDLIPFKRIKLIGDINSIIYSVAIQLILKLKYPSAKNHLIWMFFPQLVQLIKVKLPFWKVIDDIVDFHTSPNYQEQKNLTIQKQLLLLKSDVITVNSYILEKKFKILTNKPMTVVPQGFSYDKFENNQSKSKITLKNDKPLIGFIGQISQRLDFELLKELISQNEQWNFIFVGPKHHEPNIIVNKKHHFLKRFEELIKFENCMWFDSQPKDQIGSIIKQLDICVIPYDISYDFNRFCYPMKLFEYFYMKKPVISTPIEELKHTKFKNLIKIGDTAKEWEIHIKSLLKKPWPKELQKKEQLLAIDNSWENKVEAISDII